MKTVHLRLPIGPQGKYTDLRFGIHVSPSELVTLSKYNEHMTRVRDATILRRGMRGLEKIHISLERGFVVSSVQWSDAELHELLHVLRLVTLKGEPASYSKVAALLYKLFPFENVQSFIADCNQAYEHGEASFYMQASIGDQRIFDESLLRLWLNGCQYHSDTKKSELWAELEASISESSARALVISQLHSKTLALLNIDYVAKQVFDAENDDSHVKP